MRCILAARWVSNSQTCANFLKCYYCTNILDYFLVKWKILIFLLNSGEEGLDKAVSTVTGLFRQSLASIFAYTGNARFSATGIEKCLQYFLERGHEVKVYLAASMLEKREVSEEDRKKLRKLHNEDRLVPTPSRRTSIQSYDCYEVK